MKKGIAIALGILVIYSVSGQDILYDFENGRGGFSIYSDGSLTASVDTTSETAHNGNSSLKIQITNSGTGSTQLLAKRINVVPGESFTVRFYMKASENRTVILKSQYNLEGGGIAVYWENANAEVTTLWQLFEIQMVVPTIINGHIPLNVFVGFIELNLGGVNGLKYFIDDYEVKYPAVFIDNGIPEKFFVSPSGSDGNAGSKESPFRTINAATGFAGSGDTVFIRNGVYAETIITGSGTESQALVIMAYPGEKVIISGVDTAKNWQITENDIYCTDIPDKVTQVFCDGSQMTGARWPDLMTDDLFKPKLENMDYLAKASIGDTAIITDAGISGLPDVTGSRIWMMGKAMWGSMSEAIISHNGSEVRFINHQTADIYSDAYPDNGSLFFLYGARSLLDAEKEWFFDSGSKKLYFRSPGSNNPVEHTVLYRTRQNGLDMRNAFVKISGIEFFSAGATITGNHNIIENCIFNYPCPFFDVQLWNINPGILLKGYENSLLTSEIAYSWGSGIEIAEMDNPDATAKINQRIDNCLVHHTNWMGAYDGALWVKGKGHYIGNNTIYRTGRSGIHGVNKRCVMEKNHIYDFGNISHDCGAFYLGMGNEPLGDKDSLVIKKNYTHLMNSGIDPNALYLAGIYLDVGSSNALVFNNITEGTSIGVQMNGQVINNKVFNNIMYNVTWEAMHQYDQGDPGNKYINVSTYNNVSNNSIFLGTDKRNNIYKTDFTEFKLAGPQYGDFRPLPGSPLINAGIEVAGYTDYAVDLPDAGAYEFGGDDEARIWIAGIKWSPSWNMHPNGEILVKPDTLNYGKFDFSVVNDTDSDGWIMRYDWDFGDGILEFGKETSHTFSQAGMHTAKLTLRDNLAGLTILQTEINLNSILVPKFNISLYPDPVTENLVINSNIGLENFEIWGINGNVLKKVHGLAAGETILYIGELPSGLLIIHIFDHQSHWYKKIIKI